MKVRSSVKKMCKGCKVAKYNQKVYIRCNENPRHKQRQLFSTIKPTLWARFLPAHTDHLPEVHLMSC